MKAGHQVSREGWHGKRMFIELQIPDENSKMTLPYIYMGVPKFLDDSNIPSSYSLVPWIASQTDLLSEDWVEVEVVEYK